MNRPLFEAYLKRRYLSLSYASTISGICREEGLDFAGLAKDIVRILALYSVGGAKEDIGKKNHSRKICALRMYKEFLDDGLSFDFIDLGSGHFFGIVENPPVGFDTDILPELEGEYEAIFGLGVSKIYPISYCADIKRIPVILSPEIYRKKYSLSDEDIARKICRLFRDKRCNVKEREVVEILNKRSFTDKILGEFYAGSEPYIVIYYNAIGGFTREEKIAGIAQTLAHEFMHYMEYIWCKSKDVSYYQDERVSEGMADFFAMLYMVDRLRHRLARDERIAQIVRRYNTWVDRFDTSWPYANALYFYSVYGIEMGYSENYDDFENHGCVDKLKEVLENSPIGKNAFNIMIN